jgi:hypothetical protein
MRTEVLAVPGAQAHLVPPAHTADARAILGPDKLLILRRRSSWHGRDAGAPGRLRGLAHHRNLPDHVTNLRWYGPTDEDFAGAGRDRWAETPCPGAARRR